MYDEFEQAVTGQPKKRMPFWGWALIVFGFMMVLGVVGIGYALNRAYNVAVDRVEEFARDFDFTPEVAAAAIVSRLASHAELISAEPEEGLTYLETLDVGDGPSEAFMEELVQGVFDFDPEQTPVGTNFEAKGEGGFFTIRSDEGEVHLDFRREQDGGSLTIDSDEGQVRFNLKRTGDGGFLTIDSDDGQVRMDLKRTEDGGYFSIDSDEGNVRFDLIRGDEGGRIVIETDDEVIRFGLGDDAEAMPSWVPRLDGMPDDPRQVYSLDAEEGFLGAVAWEQDASPEDVLEFYKELLEDQGYEFKASHRLHMEEADGGSLWARNEATQRMVFVVAHSDDAGRTGVLLGYGEGDR